MLEQADIVLLTVNDHETEQVQRAFGKTQGAVSAGGRSYWDYGEIGGARVVHTMTPMADLATAGAVRDALMALNPVLFVAVGIAWGASQKEQAIGDLLLGHPIRDAAHHKDSDEKGMQPRGEHFGLDDRLLQNLKTNHWDWVRQQPDVLDPKPKALGDGLWRNPRPALHAGLLLTLPTLIDSLPTRDRLLAAHPGAIGGEMEGRGLASQAQAEKCDAFVLKAICDWAANKNASKAQKKRDQQLAATRAADFVRYAVEHSLGPYAVHERGKRAQRAGSPEPPEKPTLDSEVTRYYHQLASACDVVTAQNHYPSAKTPSTQSKVEDVYVEPDVWVRSLDPQGAEEPVSKEGVAPAPERLLWKSCFNSDEKRFQRIALLADGGMGKTTAVDREIQRLCDGQRPWLALRLPSLLRVDVGVPLPELVVEALTLDIAARLNLDRSAAEKIGHSLLNHLDWQAGVLLFDGFDEVPVDQRPDILNSVLLFLASAARKQPHHKVVLTSRPYAADPAEVQAELARHGFEQLRLAPFSPEQQAELVTRYFNVAPREPVVGQALIQQLRDLNQKEGEVRHNNGNEGAHGLAALMREPMLATYACMLAEERTRTPNQAASNLPLPTTRHELLDSVVELLLEKWDVKRRDSEQTKPFACLFEPDPSVDAYRSSLRRLLERAALREHLSLEDTKTAAGWKTHPIPVPPSAWQQRSLYEVMFQGEHHSDLTADWLIARIDRAMPADLAVRAHRVAEWLTQRSGLMRSELRNGSEEPLMQHRQLADFLAAGALGHDRSSDDHARALVEQAWFSPDWSRQMIALGFERLVAAARRPGKAANTAALCAGLAHWRAWTERLNPEDAELFTAVLAQALAQAIPADWLVAGAEQDKALNIALDPMRERLVAILAEQRLSARERAAAADVLGALGDPRFAPGLWLPSERYGVNTEVVEPLPGFVRVVAGRFWMGDQAFKDNPRRQALIESDFYIARCPTTVAQYARFMAAGGYEQGAEVWGEAGLAWRQKEQKNQPRNWAEQRHDPHRPVLGVSWWEARAYASWVNRDPEWLVWLRGAPQWSGYRVALPTERQWERAARSDPLGEAHGRSWPWGEGDDAAQRANVKESGVGRVSAVGCFPPSPFGVWDLAGNVWEWMSNAYEDPAYTAQPLATEIEQQRSHRKLGLALRGGAWVSSAVTAHTSVRLRFSPDDGNDYVGFRLVLTSAT